MCVRERERERKGGREREKERKRERERERVSIVGNTPKFQLLLEETRNKMDEK